MLYFPDKIVLRWLRGAANALDISSIDVWWPPPLTQFVRTGTSPRAVWTPAGVPGGSFWWNVLTNHDHTVVDVADRPWRAVSEAHASFSTLRFLPYAEHLWISQGEAWSSYSSKEIRSEFIINGAIIWPNSIKIHRPSLCVNPVHPSAEMYKPISFFKKHQSLSTGKNLDQYFCPNAYSGSQQHTL